MLRNTLLALSLASLSTISPLTADEKTKGSYVFGSIGSAQITDVEFLNADAGGTAQFDTGLLGEIGIGYDFGDFRTELTFNSTRNELSGSTDVDFTAKSYLISAAYDFRSDKKLQPYISLGVGSSNIDFDSYAQVNNTILRAGDDDATTTIIKVGLNYEASENIDLYGELWGQDFKAFTIGLIEFEDVTAAGASLGIRVKL